MFSSLTDEWPTPQWLFDALHAEFGFTLDPCATEANAKCARFFTRAKDGLQQDWSRDAVFMNPPYGRLIVHWVKKAFESAQQGALVVCLLPARTDTRWWHDYVMRGEIRLFRGRLTFEGGQYPAPFPSAIVVFRPQGFRLMSVGGGGPIRITPARRLKTDRPTGFEIGDGFPNPPQEILFLNALRTYLGLSPEIELVTINPKPALDGGRNRPKRLGMPSDLVGTKHR